MDREALIHFVAGALGGTAGTALTCPLEVIKTRLQSSNYGKTRNAAFFKQIIRTEGFTAMYKGLLPNLVGVAPSKAIYFYTYSTCKRLFNESDLFLPDTAITHMLSAAFAGFVTSTAINPVWLVKTRLQLHRGPLSIRECIKKIYKHEGPRGFYKGVTASYMGISETIIQFVLYENFRSMVDDIEFSHEKTKFANFMLAGGAAKFFACVIAYPHEVVRTRLREENSHAKGFFSTFQNLYREGGYRMLYRGISVQLLRRSDFSFPNPSQEILTVFYALGKKILGKIGA